MGLHHATVHATARPRSRRLRHAPDIEPGITRHRTGRGFSYRYSDGRLVRDAATVARIRRLAIPPAWTDVWISTRPNGHVQSTGRDARGRKQYRYHADWTSMRSDAKYDRLLAFGRALPALRRRTRADLARHGLPRRKVVALVVRMLEATLIRVGNEEYARHNGSFGLTTMLDRHVAVAGRHLQFSFRGKGGKHHRVAVDDSRLAALVRRCRDLPGSQLFQYRDAEHRVRDIGSGDVNGYLSEVMGQPFSAKDFRTWAGTVRMAQALDRLARTPSHVPGANGITAAVASVASELGNTKTVCRKSYVHPAVVEAYLGGTLTRALETASGPARRRRHPEAAVLALLQRHRKHPLTRAA